MRAAGLPSGPALLALTLAATLFSGAAGAVSNTPPPEEMVSAIIVKPHHRTGARLDQALRAFDASELVRTGQVPLRVARRMSDDSHVVKLAQPVTLSEARVIAARLLRDGAVELAEPDRILYPAAFTPADPAYYPNQWHYMRPAGVNQGGANLPSAWDVTLGSTGVIVAVLDTGYRQHADLAPLLPGYDFMNDSTFINGTPVPNGDGDGRDADARDPGDAVGANECGTVHAARNASWHGTHVAGTIAALANNGRGGAGVAPNVRILPVRVLGKCGGATSDIIDGMRWAAGLYAIPGVGYNRNVARVLNISLGTRSNSICSQALQGAVNDVLQAGKVIVAATGNEGIGAISQPANCAGVIAVTAHTVDGDNARYANIAPQVAISAPGGGCGAMSPACVAGSAGGPGVYSLSNAGAAAPDTTAGGDTYSVKTGTSMAAPHVSGVVALMLSLNPSLTPAQVLSYLRSSARPHPPGSTCTRPENAGKCGAGLLDAEAALTMLAPTVSVGASVQVVAPGSHVSLNGGAMAQAGRTIVSYAWSAAPSNPAGVTLMNAATPNAAFTAPAAGLYSFVLTTIDDSGRSATASATVRVNSAPVLTALPDQQVMTGLPLEFRIGAVDSDGDAPVFHAVKLPDGATLDAAGTFTWSSATPVGKYDVVFYASDSDANSTQGMVSVEVIPPAGSGGGGALGGELLLAAGSLAFGLRLRRASIAPARAG